jgi:ParB family chromosome partitioning protein
MAEFADEPAALDRILKAAGAGWGFQHAVATERSKRDSAAAKERVKAELVLAGVKVTGKPKEFGYGGTAVDARHLVDAAGQPVDVEQARTRPGFAAFVERIGDTAQAVVYCVDPPRYGYARRSPGGHELSEADRVARAEAELAREALRAGLTTAAGVRRDFVQQTYGTARAAKRLFVEALRETVSTAASIRFDDLDGLHTALGGASGDVVASAGEDRLRRCLVAQWICAHENNLRHAASGRDWAVNADAAAFWLDRLVTDGYLLSDAETTLRVAFTAESTEEDTDEDADGGGPVTED